MSSRRPPDHRLVATACAVVALGMVGAAFAAVPLYRAFCQATGFNGAPNRARTNLSAASDRIVSVRFDANVHDLPFTLEPEVGRQTIKVGRTQLTNFTITNNGDRALTTRATYNVAPESAAHYFTKLQCFCFSDQTIPAHSSKTFPVVYYVDAGFAKDAGERDVNELTLSYTLFPAPTSSGKPGA